MLDAKGISQIFTMLGYLGIISFAWAKKWEFELLNVTTISSDPSIIDINYKIERISRGVYGVSGYFNLSVDLYDDTILNATLYRSRTINGPFIKAPMKYYQRLSRTMNDLYKKTCMETMRECSTSGNAPYFKDTFVPPLTARFLVLEKCIFKTDELPSALQEAYYRLHIEIQHPIEVAVHYLVQVKNIFS